MIEWKSLEIILILIQVRYKTKNFQVNGERDIPLYALRIRPKSATDNGILCSFAVYIMHIYKYIYMYKKNFQWVISLKPRVQFDYLTLPLISSRFAISCSSFLLCCVRFTRRRRLRQRCLTLPNNFPQRRTLRVI